MFIETERKPVLSERGVTQAEREKSARKALSRSTSPGIPKLIRIRLGIKRFRRPKGVRTCRQGFTEDDGRVGVSCVLFNDQGESEPDAVGRKSFQDQRLMESQARAVSALGKRGIDLGGPCRGLFQGVAVG